MKYLLSLSLLVAIVTGCNNENEQQNNKGISLQSETAASADGAGWRGTITNGMKGDAVVLI